MSDNKMYDILGKFNNLDPKLTPVKETKAKETVYEEVEARGSITEAVKSLEEKYMGFKKTVAAVKKGGSAEDPEAVAAAIGRKKYGKKKFQKAAAQGKKLGEAAKPDYIDLDKDGNKTEPMKKAAKDAKKKAVKEAEEITDLDAYQFADPDKDATLTPVQAKKAAAERRRKLQDIEDRRASKDDWYSGKDKPSNVRVHHAKYQDEPELDEDMSPQELASRKKEAFAAHDDATAEYGMFTGAETGFGAMKKKKVKPTDHEDDLDEVAPPGAKAERMVKHIKKGYAKDGKLTKKERGIAYATAWKAHNKGKLQESRVMEESDYMYERIGKAMAEKNPTLDTASPSFIPEIHKEMVAQGIDLNRARNITTMDRDFVYDVATAYGHHCQQIAECGAPMNSLLGGTTVEQELDEIARLAGLPVQETDVHDMVNTEESRDDMEEGNAFTGKLALTKKGEKFELDGKEYTDTSDLGESALEEEEMGEGNEFSGALAKARASGAKEFEVDGKKYTVKEDVNINISANGEEDAMNLIRKLAGMPEVEAPVRTVQADDEGAELDEERDIEHANTPQEKVAPVDAAIPSGTDLHRSKEQDPRTANKAANPLAVKEDNLWHRYTGLLKELISKK